MDSDPFLFMGNFFLYDYENKWLLSTKKINLVKAGKFWHAFRSWIIFKGNYSEELELKKKNISPLQASFLNLSMNIKECKLNAALYDKRDASPFSIVRMPYCDSNLPSKIFHASIISEILHLARINSENYVTDQY